MHPNRSPQFHRRAFLRGTGAALALPFLEGMLPASARGAATAASTPPKRFLSIHVALGLLPDRFFPRQIGSGYQLPSLLEPMGAHRDKFTVFSGLHHPEVHGGHRAVVTFLTGTDIFGQPGYDFKNTISLDQVYADHVGSETRFSSLQLATSGNRSASSWDTAWTIDGIALPPISRPRDVFDKLFGAEDAKAPEARLRTYHRRSSILDRVLGQAKSLERKLGRADQEKLDEYLTAVRSVEGRIDKAEAWANEPKPSVAAPRPTFNSNKDVDMLENMKIMSELIALAFKTDSTRSINLQIPANNTVFKDLAGVTGGYHSLSHHGKEPEKIAQLETIERAHMTHVSTLLDQLANADENGTSLLDSTTVLLGSGLGNASSHSNKRLPVLVAGGGLKSHGQHLAFDKDNHAPPPLANLYVSLLQNLGVPTDRFATSTGAMTELL